jgi:DNA-binding NtrC family response regulator
MIFKMASILLIEDEEGITLSLKALFEGRGYDFINAYTGREGLHLALKELPDVVLLDLRLPDIYGLEILKELKSKHPEIAIIIMTGYGEIKEAVEAIKLGAEHYLQKPVDLDEIIIIVERALDTRKLKQKELLQKGPYPIIGRSRHIQGLIHLINLLASNPSTTVLIEGETGTGKELVARNIHILSNRGDKPFVDINCASLPVNIFETELFGYEAGAFTDAKTTKKGLFEIADGGTIFLDEIAEMPLPVQAKLLRVLETKTFRRIGGTRDIKIDVRVIAATNRDLAECVKKGTFREDLYYRLNVMPLKILPLRERPEDIPLLVEYFIEEFSKNMNKRFRPLDTETIHILCSYHWPGNVRELRNVLERAAILSTEGVIRIPELLQPETSSSRDTEPLSLKEVERLHIKKVLELTGKNRTKAAQLLGISRSTLNEKIKQYNLS